VDPHVLRVKAISSWLERFDIGDPSTRADISVDVADCLHAATKVDSKLNLLLSRNLDDPREADEALSDSCEIAVLLFEEMTPHLDELHRIWGPIVTSHIANLLPPDDNPDELQNDSSQENPYEKWRDSEPWFTIAQSVRELSRNGDIDVTTGPDYVIGFLCKNLDEAGLLRATPLHGV
jgi:hypothetical protein